jgi:hypothetical protein
MIVAEEPNNAGESEKRKIKMRRKRVEQSLDTSYFLLFP